MNHTFSRPIQLRVWRHSLLTDDVDADIVDIFNRTVLNQKAFDFPVEHQRLRIPQFAVMDMDILYHQIFYGQLWINSIYSYPRGISHFIILPVGLDVSDLQTVELDMP